MNLIDRANQSMQWASKRLGFDCSQVQQGSADWLNLRLGVLSASNADKILAKTTSAARKTYMAQLCKEVLTCEPGEQMPFKQLEWGNTWEDDAREALSFAVMENIVEVPFIYRDESMRAGCSPDGVFGGTMVELKCPYDSATFVKFALMDDVKKEYSKQVQFQLWCSQAEVAIFGNYDNRMKLTKQLHYVEFDRDEKMQKTFDDAVPQFIADMDALLESVGVKFGDHWDHISDNRGKV